MKFVCCVFFLAVPAHLMAAKDVVSDDRRDVEEEEEEV